MTIKALLPSPKYTSHDETLRHLTLPKQTKLPILGAYKSTPTHTLPDINILKNAIRQEIANVTQDTLRRVMASVPGRWQQCLDCHGGHLQDVVLKT